MPNKSPGSFDAAKASDPRYRGYNILWHMRRIWHHEQARSERQDVRGVEAYLSSDELRFVDLFAGIGGFHLALKDIGTCVLAAEIDADCRDVYQGHFPETKLIADVRELTATPRSIPAHDILCAGFPCQPFSKSGAQLGLHDRTRGTLFFEIMEIIRHRHPRYLILENVRNLAGPRHSETWQIIVDSLREEGYSIAGEPAVFSPHLLPPELDGRPQVRERIFILATRDKRRAPFETAPLVRNRPVARWSPLRWRIADYLDDDSTIPDIARYQLREDEVRWIDAWQDFIEHLDVDPLPGFPIWVDSFKSNEHLQPETPLWKSNFVRKNRELYAANAHWIDDWIDRRGVLGFPTSRRKFEWQARGQDHDLWKLVIHFRPSGIRVKAATYLPALVAITQTSVIASRRRRITPREAARLQGFPENFTLHEDAATAYRQLGNAVNVGVVRYVANKLLGLTDDARQLELVS